MSEKQKSFRDTFVGVEGTIMDALRSLDYSGRQVALIVDGDHVLKGIVTDGDIRRGILHGLPLDAPVTKIMSTTPITVPEHTTPTEVLEVMHDKQVHQVPVLDFQGRVVALERINAVLEKQKQELKSAQPVTLSRHKLRDIPVVLMVGGEGKRLRPLTSDVPKPMLHIGGKPLLETIIQNFVAQGFHKFFLSVNYKADVIRGHFGDGERFGAEIRYITEEKKMGTAGSLALLPKLADVPLIVMNGDLLTNVNFKNVLEFHQQNDALATMCVREYSVEIPYGVVKNTGVKLSSIVEKPSQNYFANAGIYVLDPQALSYVPKGSVFTMPQLFSAINNNGGDATVFPIHEYWIDIGRFEDLERARAEYHAIFGDQAASNVAG